MFDLLSSAIRQGKGDEPADLVLKGGRFLDLVTGVLVDSDIAITGGRITGTFGTYAGKTEMDISGKVVVPGFIDTHLHVESSLVTPLEFDRCVLRHGVTTAICDPHEIANVLGCRRHPLFSRQRAGNRHGPARAIVELRSRHPSRNLRRGPERCRT